MKTKIAFLAMILDSSEIRTNRDRVEVLKSWSWPKSLFEFGSFLGLLQFFRRFIRNFSWIAAPLNNITNKYYGIDKWHDNCDDSFQKLKDRVTCAPILISLDIQKPFRGHIDVSKTAAGVTFSQLDDNGKDRVIPFFSKKMTDPEEDCTANDREVWDWSASWKGSDATWRAEDSKFSPTNRFWKDSVRSLSWVGGKIDG